MATLNLEDLMSGDIVLAEATWFDDETGNERVEWHPFRITDISPNGRLYTDDNNNRTFIGDWLDDCDAEEVSDFKPMPLTPEIATINGYGLYLRANDNLCYMRHNFEYPLVVFSSNGNYYHCNPQIELNYIYQFQHLLHSYGLHKFAREFKIKA